MKATINQSGLFSVVSAIARIFKVKVRDTAGEYTLRVPKRLGEGIIKGMDFRQGLGLLIFNLKLKEDLILTYAKNEPQPVRMLFCRKGKLMHILDSRNLQYKLTPSQSAIAAGSDSKNEVIIIPAGLTTSFQALEINRGIFKFGVDRINRGASDKFMRLFAEPYHDENFLYQGEYSIQIAEIMNELDLNEYTALVRLIYMESKALELLSMHIKQYEDDQKMPGKRQILREADVYMILKARTELLKNLKKPPTIRELAKIMGTNENKLKSGFRKVFNKSIYETVKEARLAQAKVFLAENNRSIKEIANLVGYENPGAFTKRFKERFGVLPRYFLNRAREAGK